MIQNLSNTLFRKITSHWLVLPAIFFCYLLWNTGLHGDDYAEIFRLKKDDSAYVPPNSKQFIENIGSKYLRFLCIVEPAWKAEDDEILE